LKRKLYFNAYVGERNIFTNALKSNFSI